MSHNTQVIDFQQDRGAFEARRLRDLPDRVLQGDPHHESTVFYSSAAGDMTAGTWTFVIPNGFSGCWEVVETTTKHFVVCHQEAH